MRKQLHVDSGRHVQCCDLDLCMHSRLPVVRLQSIEESARAMGMGIDYGRRCACRHRPHWLHCLLHPEATGAIELCK